MLMKSIISFVARHKALTVVLGLVLVTAGYFGARALSSQGEAPRYAFAEVRKGTLTVVVSGSGQVSASNQIELTPKTSGDVVGVYTKAGQEVKAGTLIVKLDDEDEKRELRDAETALETAQLELAKILEPVDELELLKAQHALAEARETEEKADDNLGEAYEDGFNAVADAFLSLPGAMAGLQNTLFTSSISGSGWNIDYYTTAAQNYDGGKILEYRADTYADYDTARRAYDLNFADYRAVSRFGSHEAIETLVAKTYDTARLISEAAKSATTLIQFYQDKIAPHHAMSDTHLTALASYQNTANSHTTGLFSARQALKNAREAVLGAERTVKERMLSLQDVEDGPDELDIRAKRVAVEAREDALATARENLADTELRAPFAGVVAKIDAEVGDSASANASLAVLVTKQKIAEITLNEVDVVKIKEGQGVTLTFDAVPDLTMAGQVTEVDAVGTTNQGVVTYAVKIAFGADDARVKTAMSVTADVVTDEKHDVLLVPNAAVKSANNEHFVETASRESVRAAAQVREAIAPSAVMRQEVQIGLSNDDYTEVTGGLAEGDVVVVRTLSTGEISTARTQAQGRSGVFFGAPSGGARRSQ